MLTEIFSEGSNILLIVIIALLLILIVRSFKSKSDGSDSEREGKGEVLFEAQSAPAFRQDDKEIVAVISAAVALMMEASGTSGYKIRSIRRASKWNKNIY